jgi:hypothetical protein
MRLLHSIAWRALPEAVRALRSWLGYCWVFLALVWVAGRFLVVSTGSFKSVSIMLRQ